MHGNISFDLSDWSQIEVIGPDAKTFLQGFCTSDLRKLNVGQGCETFFPTIKGRILGHALLFIHTEGVHVIAVPDSAATLVPHLQKYLLDANAEIRDSSSDKGLLCLCGETINDLLETTFGIQVPSEPYSSVVAQEESGDLLISRVDLTNLPSVLISGPRSSVADFRERTPVEMLNIGDIELFHQLRIEAGFPWHGRDITDENVAQEGARTERAISFTKGCYLGQEPIARLDAMGHMNKELRGLVIDASDVPPGSLIWDGEEQVGTITSSAWSPQRSQTVALGMVRTSKAQPGTQLTVQCGERSATAIIYWPRLAPPPDS